MFVLNSPRDEGSHERPGTLHASSHKAVENLPYHVSVNDVSEMIVLIGTNKNPLKIVFVSCYCELHFLYLYLKLLISLLQEFISWLSSVSPEDSVLVCWDDEVTLSKLFCTC